MEEINGGNKKVEDQKPIDKAKEIVRNLNGFGIGLVYGLWGKLSVEEKRYILKEVKAVEDAIREDLVKNVKK